MAWDTTVPATTSKISDAPAEMKANFDAIEYWTNVDHYGLTNALSGCHRPGQCSFALVAPSATIEAATDVACGFAFATDIHDFGYNNGSSWTIIGGPIESGTVMVFNQVSAPTGWTLSAAMTDKLIYITGTTTSGGKALPDGTWTLTGWGAYTNSTTIAAATMPSHTHTHDGTYWLNLDGTYDQWYVGGDVDLNYAGSGNSHQHDFPAFTAGWRPVKQFCIIAIKD